jgi:ABC-type phosphate transport system ATPase subunit
MHIEFEDLGMVLRSTGKRVLMGVTGQVRHARLTAIMGPSGAGMPWIR